MKNFLLGSLLCLSTISLRAQMFRTPVAAIYTQLNTYSSQQADAFSFPGNQAALASVKNFSAGVYGERRFFLQDLSQYQIAFALPTASGNFGLEANHSGNNLFNESRIGFAYGRSLGKIDVGVQFNYYMMRISEYGNASSFNFEGGVLLHLSEKFQTGVHIYNPLKSAIGKNGDERLPVLYAAGFGYDVSESMFIGCSIEKEEHQPVNIRTGLQYAFDKKFFVRTGISSSASVFYLGLGFLWNAIRIDATASLHPQLGISPGIMLIYTKPAKK